MQVYLAAFETQFKNYKVDLPKTANLFCTYYYRKLTEHALLFLKESKHQGIITIDSGAHSFFELMGISVTSKEASKKDLPDPYKYFEEYLAWVKQWYDYFDYFVELDLQELVGQKTVLEWRERMKKEKVYGKCITVWHSYNSYDDYLRQLADSQSKYVAIEGIRKGQPMLDYNRYIKAAHERKIKIHGFALTRTTLLEQCPFYSVDSSSWTSSIRYGKIHVWDEAQKKVKIVDSKPEHFFKYNVPIRLHSKHRAADDNKCKLEFNALAYFKMQEYFTKLWKARGIVWKD